MTVCETVDIKFVRTMWNKRLRGHTLLTFHELQITSCIIECTNVIKCGSVNYQPVQRWCELNKYSPSIEDEQKHLAKENGWIFYGKSQTEVGKFFH